MFSNTQGHTRIPLCSGTVSGKHDAESLLLAFETHAVSKPTVGNRLCRSLPIGICCVHVPGLIV